MLNTKRTYKSPRVVWALGDGTSALRDPINQNWILATSAIMELLEGKTKNFPYETFKGFSVNTVYEEFEPDAAPIDTSLALSLQFHRIIKDVFKNKDIIVKPSSFQSLTSCPWSSVLFEFEGRRCGLHFLLKEPFFEMFIEPTGPAPEKKQRDEENEPSPQFRSPLDVLNSMRSQTGAVQAPVEAPYHSKFGKRW
jgi:hypothetical protein